MAVLFGMGVGLVYGGLFAGVAGTLVPHLARARRDLLERWTSAPRFALVATAVLYVGILYWGLLGAAFGLLFLLAEAMAPAGRWVFPNLAYSASVAGLTLLLAGPALLRLRRGRPQVAFLAASFLLTFGWLLPLLAA